MSSSTDNIKVAIKARPLIQREVAEGLQQLWRIKNDSVYQTDEVGGRCGDVYTFDHVFNEDCTNTDVYTTVVRPLVEAFMEGFNATIFAYGQTSSGKTHTILGSKNEDGLFHLVVKEIFKHVAAKEEKIYLIRYFEIYNEKINDLLEKTNQALSIREDVKGNMLLNAREAVVTNVAEVVEKMMQGKKLRRTGATCMNERSSRSHTIFRIILESKDANEEHGPVHISQLNLVDLAGSERVAQTKAAGERLKEGVNINKSLSVLGNVIRQLSEGQQYVNYRDSKLTRLLTQSLGGNGKSLIIANITLVAGEETKSTLEFAQRAKNVKNKPEVNILSTRDEAIKEYQSMQQNLESRLKKQAEMLQEMERHKEECLIEIERLKMEATIVGRFQSGASDTKTQKPSRRHTIGDYGTSTSKECPLYKPLKHFPQGGGSPGREMKTIHEDSFQEALAEAELITFDVPPTVLKRQLDLLEQSYAELKEFTKLEKEFCHDELIELREKATTSEAEISRLNEELVAARQLFNEQREKNKEYSKKAQEYEDLQYKFEFMEQKYKTTLTTYENEIESLRNQLKRFGQTETPDFQSMIPALEAKNIELTAKISQLEAIINNEIEDQKDTLSKLNILKNILTETEFDVQGTETQTDETAESVVEMTEELDFQQALVAKLKNDITQLKDQMSKLEIKYTFEISELRSDNQTTVNEVLEQCVMLEEQNEILTNRIIEKDDELDRLQGELEIKQKEIAGIRRLESRSPTEQTAQPDPLDPKDIQFHKHEVEFTRNLCKNLVEQMEEAVEQLKVDHQQEINKHIKNEAELIKEKSEAEDKCNEYVEDIRDLEKEIRNLQSQIGVMNDLLHVETEEDVDKLINTHTTKMMQFEEELAVVSQQYAEDFKCFMDAFVDSLHDFKDASKEEDKELLEGYIGLFSDESRDRFLILSNFLDQTRGFSDLRYAKHMQKLRSMGNYWVYQEKTTRERDLRGKIQREQNNLEYLRKMRFNLDYRTDTTAIIRSLEEMLTECRRQHRFEIANLESRIEKLVSENENLNIEEQNQRLAAQIELLEKKLVESGDIEELKVVVENLELENQSLKDILEKSRDKIIELEAVNEKVVELTSENQTLKNKLEEYDKSIADLPEITNERNRLKNHVNDLKKELENLQVENDSMRMKMVYMKDVNEEHLKKINICIEVKKELEIRLNEVTDRCNSLSLENEAYDIKIQKLEDELNKLKQQIQMNDQHISHLNEALAYAKAKANEVDKLKDKLVEKELQLNAASVEAKEARDLRKINKHLQSELASKTCQEQPNILKETFRRHKEKISILKSENGTLREQIKSLQHEFDTSVSTRVEAYKKRTQSLEKEKMNLIQQVYDLERKIRGMESEWETVSSTVAATSSAEQIAKTPQTFKLKLESPMLLSPDVSPRELSKMKRHSLHDARRGLPSQDEIAGPSQEPEKIFSQGDWDKACQRYTKECAVKDKQIEVMRSNDVAQKKHIKELEAKVKKLQKVVEPTAPGDLLTSEPFKYDHPAARKEQIAKLEQEVESLRETSRELEDVKTQNALLKKGNEESNQQLKKMLAELADAKNVCSSYAQQLAASKGEVKTLKDHLRIMHNSNEDLQSRIIAVQAKLQWTETDLLMKEQVIGNLERDVARLNNRLTTSNSNVSLDDYKKQLDRETELHQKDNAEKEIQIQELQNRIRCIEERLTDQENKNANLHMEKKIAEETYNKNVKEIETKLHNLNIDYEQTEQENRELKLKLQAKDTQPSTSRRR